jgi:hypothetical protein
VIYLFTVACPDRGSASWWARLMTIEARSFCFDGLTTLLEPEPTLESRFHWLESLGAGLDPELADRLVVLRGFPGYFERLWERNRVDGAYHVGNADAAVDRLLPGLRLLWPHMRFLLAYRDGIAAVGEAGVTDFERACRDWAETTRRLRAQQARLAKHGAELREVRLERIASGGSDLRDVWTWLLGEWEHHEAHAEEHARELAAAGRSADEIWERWTPDQRAVFTELCKEPQHDLGYGLPGEGHRRGRLGIAARRR